MKLLYLIVLITILISCQSSDNTKDNVQISKEDSIHLSNIENNLIPFYSIEGETLRKTIPQMMREDNIAGVSMAFIDKGRIAWTKCYGFANIEDSIVVTPQTVFQIGSVSKPVATMAALKMVENGDLSLTEDVNLKLKGWKIPENNFTAKSKVTLEQLIGHTSGIENDVVKFYELGEELPTREQLLSGTAASGDKPITLVSVPGEKYKYSNPAYLVMEELMTDVAGKDFNKIMTDLVFEPCKMNSSSFEQPIPRRLMKLKAIGYDSDLNPLPYNVYPFKAGGGMWSTSIDLGKFLIALLNDHNGTSKTLISKEMADKVFSKESKKSGFTKWYWKNDVLFRHDGTIPGFSCFVMGSVDNDQAIVVLTNSSYSHSLLNFIWRTVAEEYKWEYFRPEFYDKIIIEKESLAKFSGKYSTNQDSLAFSIDDDKLYVNSKQTQGKHQLIPIGGNEFLLPSIPMKYKFTINKNGDMSYVDIWNETGDYSKAEKAN